MSRYRSTDWQQLRDRRNARKAKSALKGDHPLSHVDPTQCHQWMREDCAQYDTAREAREDTLIAIVIQITSAALLAIPALIFSASKKFPAFSEAPFLYVGLGGLFLSLILAMAEQFLSAHANGYMRNLAIQYYQKKIQGTNSPNFTKWTRRFRHSAYIVFILSLAISAVAIANYEDQPDVGRQVPAAPAPAAAPSAAAPSAAAAPSN